MFNWVKNLIGYANGIGGCLRCGDRWNWKPIHSTMYSTTNSCFPLCEPCWQGATPGDIRHYYSELVRMWRRDGSFYDQEFEDDLIGKALREMDFATLV